MVHGNLLQKKWSGILNFTVYSKKKRSIIKKYNNIWLGSRSLAWKKVESQVSKSTAFLKTGRDGRELKIE